ncbi:hypothetical protein [Blastococcus xanthinilyticus]|uniref:hypothetical protein n=1 Tax=Blastococcus xanthinilyticus TaxID=1564164 RepID=UPI001412642E|nr:hypothetical protein [Blastococcus xanthinilyticus]
MTILSDVPERFSFGHELGIGASGLGFAYLTGWIFHWLAVELPRRQALQRLYSAVALDVTNISRLGDVFAHWIFFHGNATMPTLHDDGDVGHAVNVYGPEGELFIGLREAFNQILSSIGTIATITTLLEETGVKTDHSYEALRPFLSLMEPEVAAALAETHAALSIIRNKLSQAPIRSGTIELARRDLIPELAADYRTYFAAADRLHRAIRESPYESHILGWRPA